MGPCPRAIPVFLYEASNIWVLWLTRLAFPFPLPWPHILLSPECTCLTQTLGSYKYVTPFLDHFIGQSKSHESSGNAERGAGEMAQPLRALTALPEVLNIIPSDYMGVHNHL